MRSREDIIKKIFVEKYSQYIWDERFIFDVKEDNEEIFGIEIACNYYNYVLAILKLADPKMNDDYSYEINEKLFYTNKNGYYEREPVFTSYLKYQLYDWFKFLKIDNSELDEALVMASKLQFSDSLYGSHNDTSVSRITAYLSDRKEVNLEVMMKDLGFFMDRVPKNCLNALGWDYYSTIDSWIKK